MASEINLTPTASLVDIPATAPGADAASIAARSWGTPSECVAGALLVHGLGAHSGWFEALGRRLKVKRIFALAYDQVGFGKRRAQEFQSEQQWFDDLATSYKYLQTQTGDRPVYVMGNSMGAAVALKVVSDRLINPQGLVMFSPGFDGHPRTFNLGYRISAITRALISPESEIAVPYTPDMVTRTESVRAWMQKDPDRRFSPTGKMLLGVLKLSIALRKVKQVNCPVLMLSAGVDEIVDVRQAQRIFAKLKAPSKRQHQFEQAWHDLMFDPVIDEMVDQIAQWMSETDRAPAPQSRAV
jgi:alpha-beta hydrolase superfamily lysophospholipase